jgi:ribosome-binding protein aMBF1 (putative translation factor)
MSSKSNTAELEAQIGERIRSRRIRAGVSQENLGKPLGITFQQIRGGSDSLVNPEAMASSYCDPRRCQGYP